MSSFAKHDWNRYPAPEDDGAAGNLLGARLPDLELRSTGGGIFKLSGLSGCSVFYIYPMTARPDVPLPQDWDVIPGARGCTPQSCAFRDHYAELKALGVTHLFGLSSQDTEYQREAAERLHLPFQLLSDPGLELASQLGLPTFETEGKRLFKRITLILQDGCIRHLFYPVFPPDRNAQDVIEYLRKCADA